MADYNVAQIGEDSVTDEDGTDSGADYKYTLGVHGVNTNYDGDEVPAGGDTRIHLQGAFPNEVTRTVESPNPDDVHFEAELYDETVELARPLPEEVDDVPFSPTLNIGLATGPIFGLGFASIDLVGFTGFDPNYKGELNRYYWALPQSDFPTPQENTAGVSFDLDADIDASGTETLTTRSSYGYTYKVLLSGGRAYVETEEIVENSLIDIVED